MFSRSLLNTYLVVLSALALSCSLALQDSNADATVAATAEQTTPLAAGDKAPKFVVSTVSGESFAFDPQALERPVILLTFRGGWCPYCNVQLSEMRHVLPQIGELGVDVYFLSGDRSDQLYANLSLETQEDIDGLDYTILSDANAEAAIALGIAFKASDGVSNWLTQKGKDFDGSAVQRHGVLPVPSVFAIDTDGVIQFAYSNANYRERLPADDLLQAARRIGSTD